MCQKDICLYPGDHLYLCLDGNMQDTWANREVEMQAWMADWNPKYEMDHILISGSKQETLSVLEWGTNPVKRYWAVLYKLQTTWQQPHAIAERLNDLWKPIICYDLYCNSVLPLCNFLIPQLLRKEKGLLMWVKMLCILSIIKYYIPHRTLSFKKF